jgi:hypothetical protein
MPVGLSRRVQMEENPQPQPFQLVVEVLPAVTVGRMRCARVADPGRFAIRRARISTPPFETIAGLADPFAVSRESGGGELAHRRMVNNP